jgi:hypothetical protein
MRTFAYPICTAIESIVAGRAHTRPRDSLGLRSLPNRFSRTAQSRSGNAFLFGRELGQRGDLDHDTARSVAIVVTRLPPRLGY